MSLSLWPWTIHTFLCVQTWEGFSDEMCGYPISHRNANTSAKAVRIKLILNTISKVQHLKEMRMSRSAGRIERVGEGTSNNSH